MVNDRCKLYKKLSIFILRSRRKSGNINGEMRLNLIIHLVVNKCGMPINFIVTDGSHSDCKKAIHLIENIDAG